MGTRSESLSRVVDRIGVLTREFAARRTYPFQARRLGRASMDLLFVLSREDGLSVAAIADRKVLTSGAVSQTIDVLRAAGLITSQVNPIDRRARIIRLTDEARHEVREFERGYFEAIAPQFDALSDGEVHELDRILSAVGSHTGVPS